MAYIQIQYYMKEGHFNEKSLNNFNISFDFNADNQYVCNHNISRKANR